MAEGVRYFTSNHTPLTINGAKEFVQHYIEILLKVEQDAISFTPNSPSNSRMKSFAAGQNLCSKRVQQVEAALVKAVTRENVAEHIP